MRELVYVRSRLGELERLVDRLSRQLTEASGYDKMAVDESCWAGTNPHEPESRDGAEPCQIPLWRS